MAHPHEDHREVDPVTGHDTTGHDWNGIKELNTPFPKIALVFLLLAFAYSVVAWFLLPAWPTGRSHTRGLLGLDQGQEALAGYRELEAGRKAWMSRFDKPDFAALSADHALLAEAMPAAGRLFQDNCAACHGSKAEGGPGFPALNSGHWLWGGDPATVAETITVGINSADPNTRVSQMPSFDWMAIADRQTVAEYVAALPSGKADQNSPGAKLFADNCASCHGEGGKGGLQTGAPTLTDQSFIYGQDVETELTTLAKGRQGQMPTWAARLSPEEINLLALYVSRLPETAAGADGRSAAAP